MSALDFAKQMLDTVRRAERDVHEEEIRLKERAANLIEQRGQLETIIDMLKGEEPRP